MVVFFLFFFLEKIISRGTKEGEFLRFPPSRRTNQPIKEWEFSPRIYDRCKLRVLKELLTKTLSFSLAILFFKLSSRVEIKGKKEREEKRRGGEGSVKMEETMKNRTHTVGVHSEARFTLVGRAFD